MTARPATPAALEELLRAADPLRVARAAGVVAGGTVTALSSPPAGALVDGDAERAIEEHRAAHSAGRPSEATVAYGAGREPAAVAARIVALAGLAAETGLLRAVCPVPAEGTAERPGSWGVEDLTVVAACRWALPPEVAVRPHWRRLGPAACQIAVAFGASEWVVPDESGADLDRLAAGVGAVLERA